MGNPFVFYQWTLTIISKRFCGTKICAPKPHGIWWDRSGPVKLNVVAARIESRFPIPNFGEYYILYEVIIIRHTSYIIGIKITSYFWANAYYLVIYGIAPILVNAMVWWQLYHFYTYPWDSKQYIYMYVCKYMNIYIYRYRYIWILDDIEIPLISP